MFAREDRPGSIPIHLVDEDELDAWRSQQPESTRNWLAANGFRAERHRLLLVPDANGRTAGVVFGLGRSQAREPFSLWHGAALADRLPDGTYHLAQSLPPEAARHLAFGWAYGLYRFERYRRAAPREVTLRLPEGVDAAEIERLRAATTLTRDLINTPASDMSPEALAQVALDLGRRHGCRQRVVVGDELLAQRLPAIHAVGRASVVAPRLVDLEWGHPSHPKVTLVGKGVCFDTGGLDIKPSSSMLLMKKDMGGAAVTLGLAHLVMDAQLPVRLRVIIPAVENAIAGNAYRPGDVIGTRKGLSVEVGNTDAEGRLILCDALALADEDKPDLLIDTATLTGAARVALGPEVPALFANDDEVAAQVLQSAHAESDPMWRLPLWSAYDEELASKVADLNNVSSSGFAGAIFGALFLRRFVTETPRWLHLDLYAWNGKERPGRPVGAEPQCVRALYAYLKQRYVR
jgi:leucyl aminopeptidase